MTTHTSLQEDHARRNHARDTIEQTHAAEAPQPALEIPRLTHAEAGQHAQTEYERTLQLLEALEGDDWAQQTYCTEWTVREMAAHLAGSMTGSTSFAEFRRQNVFNPYIREAANPVDGVNRLQVEERAAWSPQELVEEFRRSGRIAVQNRRDLPWIVRKIHLPLGPLGFTSIEYLMDCIYPRDEWMHRYDICAATGKQMVVTPEHDTRIVALVMLDMARKLKSQMGGRSVRVQLTGPIAGDYLFGHADSADCHLVMDVFDFNLRASGRISPADAAARATLHGDRAVAMWFLEKMEVPY